MAKRILDMLKWHPEINSKNCQVTYLHRGSPGNLKTVPFADIHDLEGGFMIMIDGAMVPYHRIVKIDCTNNLIWKKCGKSQK